MARGLSARLFYGWFSQKEIENMPHGCSGIMMTLSSGVAFVKTAEMENSHPLVNFTVIKLTRGWGGHKTAINPFLSTFFFLQYISHKKILNVLKSIYGGLFSLGFSHFARMATMLTTHFESRRSMPPALQPSSDF